MKAMSYTMSNYSGRCMNCAVAGTSADEIAFLDTVIAAVSIFVIRFVSLLIRKG